MKILELFSGTESFSTVARERGHDTVTIDNDSEFNPTICIDILKYLPMFHENEMPDIIWASPPCEGFSVAAIGKN